MKNVDFSIRSAVITDEVEIKGLLKATSGVWQEAWRDAAVAQALQSAGELALAAVRKGKIIGFACFHDVGFRAYLSEMVVAESEQGRGIGAELLNRAEKMLASSGCRLIIADAYPPAAGFYRKRGWRQPSSILLCKDVNKRTD